MPVVVFFLSPLLFDSQQRGFVDHLCQGEKKKPRTRSAIRAALSSLPTATPHSFTYLLITVAKAAVTDCHRSAEPTQASTGRREGKSCGEPSVVLQKNVDSWLFFFIEKEENDDIFKIFINSKYIIYSHLTSYHFLLALSCSQGRGVCDKMLLSTLCQTGEKTKPKKTSRVPVRTHDVFPPG